MLFIIMRIGAPAYRSQVIPLVVILIAGLLYSCTRESGDVSIVPPPTHPLSRAVIGYGVVNVSYTHVVNTPTQGGLSLGYLRRGSVVRIIERRTINTESWILIDSNYRGWLREGEVDIYDLAVQAKTAAEIMIIRD
jgi:hypothetical protein